MKIELTKEDADILCDLVFLGNWIVNSRHFPNNHVEKYREVSAKIQKLHKHILSSEEKKCFDHDEFQFYFNRLDNYIDEYDDENCFPTLARKLAETNYPENPESKSYYDNIYMQLDAMAIYQEELIEKGVSILSVDIPDMDDRLEVCRQAFKKRR